MALNDSLPLTHTVTNAVDLDDDQEEVAFARDLPPLPRVPACGLDLDPTPLDLTAFEEESLERQREINDLQADVHDQCASLIREQEVTVTHLRDLNVRLENIAELAAQVTSHRPGGVVDSGRGSPGGVPLLPPTDSDSDPGLTAFLRDRGYSIDPTLTSAGVPGEGDRNHPQHGGARDHAPGADQAHSREFDLIVAAVVAPLRRLEAVQSLLPAATVCPWCEGRGRTRGLDPSDQCPWCGSVLGGLYAPARGRRPPSDTIYDYVTSLDCVRNVTSLASQVAESGRLVELHRDFASILRFRLAMVCYQRGLDWWHSAAPHCVPGVSFTSWPEHDRGRPPALRAHRRVRERAPSPDQSGGASGSGQAAKRSRDH